MALDDHALQPLPCGVSLDDLIGQVTDGLPALDGAHQAACEFCQAALEAIRRAWEEFRELAEAAVAVPGDLADQVMRQVRALSGAGSGVVVDRQRGVTLVGDAVLRRLARQTAMATAGVVWAGATSETDVNGDVRVAVRLVVTYGRSMLQIADEVRERVIATVRAQAGAEVVGVDVAVDDVVERRRTSRNFF